MKILKILAIGFFSLLVVWFAVVCGPQPESAEAKVFERFLNMTQQMPPYLFSDKDSSKPIKVLVNTATTWFTVAKTKDDPQDVLNFYNEQYQDEPYWKLDPKILDKVKNKEISKILNQFDMLNKESGQFQHFMQVHENYGFLGVIDFRDKKHGLGSDEFNRQVKKVEETGNLGELFTGRMVMAMRDKKDNKTTVLNLWTDRDFSLHCMTPDKEGNMPGFDIKDVAIFPRDRRELSLEQDNPGALFRLVQYRGDGSLSAHILFLHNEMAAHGWKTSTAFDKAMQDGDVDNVMFYSKEKRECTIQVARDTTVGVIRTTVIENTIKKG